MSHGLRRFVSLVACAFCISSMLFLNTLQVDAAFDVSFNVSPTVTMTVHPSSVQEVVTGSVNGTISSVSGGGGIINNGSGTISSNSGGSGSVHGSITTYSKGLYTYHVVAPFDVSYDLSSIDNSDYYKVYFRWGANANINVDKGTISNFGVYDSHHNLLFSSVSPWLGSSYILSSSDTFYYQRLFRQSYIVEFDWTYEESVHIGATEYSSDVTFNTTFNQFTITVNPSDAPASTPVIDSGANQSLNSINNSSQSTANNTGGILSKITEFFGSFFSNLIGVFVPEDGYFSNWFTRLNTLLADKLGMLYAPFDLLIQVLTSIMNADSSFAGIPFPGIQWEDTWLVEPFTFTFDSLGTVYTDLQGYVYFGTDVLLLIAFFGLLQDKIKHILED